MEKQRGDHLLYFLMKYFSKDLASRIYHWWIYCWFFFLIGIIANILNWFDIFNIHGVYRTTIIIGYLARIAVLPLGIICLLGLLLGNIEKRRFERGL